MKPVARQKRILDILQAMQKEIRVESLAEMLDVSPLTIRRDLEELSKKKTIIRTHGGCIAVGRAALETEYHNKAALNFDLKKAIGRKASQLVKENQSVLLNDGSTTFHLASHLDKIQGLSVYTNSIALISVLNNIADAELYILGGKYNNQSYSLRGSLMERLLEILHFDLVFLGADAIDTEGRCMVATNEEARLLQVMMQRGENKILLADHTKIGKKEHVAFATLQDFDTWVTTQSESQRHPPEYKEMTDIVISNINLSTKTI